MFPCAEISRNYTVHTTILEDQNVLIIICSFGVNLLPYKILPF